jgi:hypothetical protein
MLAGPEDIGKSAFSNKHIQSLSLESINARICTILGAVLALGKHSEAVITSYDSM